MYFKKRKRHKKNKFKTSCNSNDKVRKNKMYISEVHMSSIRNVLLSRSRVFVWL